MITRLLAGQSGRAAGLLLFAEAWLFATPLTGGPPKRAQVSFGFRALALCQARKRQRVALLQCLGDPR